jgi:hypothetical protein
MCTVRLYSPRVAHLLFSTTKETTQLRSCSKGRDCDYTPYKEPPRNETHEDEPLIVHYETCQHTDLSPRGTTELLHAVTACINESSSSHLATKLSDLVHELLDLADVDLRAALEEFGPCIQQWCPIIPEEFLHGCPNDLSQQMSGGYDPKSPLLWLCLWLVTRRTCQHWDHIERSELYRATKQVLALLQSRKEIDLEVVHIGMLITVFEVGHAMQTQASQTLAGCIALLRILGLDSRKSKDSGLMETVDWIKVSMLMLDRYVSTPPYLNYSSRLLQHGTNLYDHGVYSAHSPLQRPHQQNCQQNCWSHHSTSLTTSIC